MIYFLVLILIICLEAGIVFNLRYSLQTKKKIFLSLVFMQLSLFIGLRGDNTNPDTLTYWTFFNSLGGSSAIQKLYLNDFEIGFLWTSKLIYYIFGPNRVMFFSVMGALSVGPVLWVIYQKVNKHILISTLTWCIMNGLNTALGNVRQAIAISFVLLAFSLITERKVWQSVFCVLLAACFHFSALFILGILPIWLLLKYIKLTPFNLLFLFLPVTLLFIFWGETLASNILYIAGGKYIGYLDRQENIALGSALYSLTTGSIFLLGTLVYFIKKTQFPPQERQMISFFLITLLIGFCFYIFSIYGSTNRMALYFVSIYVLLIPWILNTITRNAAIQKALALIVFLGLCMIILTMMVLPSSFTIMDYHWNF